MKTHDCSCSPRVSRLSTLALLWACCAFTAAAVSQSIPPAGLAPASYANEALIIESSETTYKYNEDGTGERESFMRMKLLTEAGARQFSVLSFPFASATEATKIKSIVVHHPDGTSTDTPASDGIEMPAPISQQAPLYSDLKLLQIPVRSLRAGDVLEYRVAIQRKNPEAASQFWDAYTFTKNFVVLSETITLDIPKDKYVKQWSSSSQPTTSENAGRTVYVWTASQLKPTPSGAKKDDETSEAPKPAKPDVAWTTFHTWAEVGEWYRSLAAPRAASTDAIRAQADEITRAASTPEAQVQALYAFVSTHIRYIGIDFGVGRYQPHLAAEVLANQYGDCKDKDTLFEALLHAKGISSAPALIGVNIELVPDLPSPTFFNHVITTVNLASGRVWVDTTPGVAPYRLLVNILRDKPALVMPSTGNSSLEHTPSDLPFPFVDHFEAVATLNKDGELSGHVNITDRSDNEILVRSLALGLAPAQWDSGTQYLAYALGFSGATSNSRFEHPEDISQPVHLTYDYNKKPFGDWDNFRIVPLFPVIPLPVAPTKEPTSEIDLGALRTENIVSRIHLPEGFGVDLPDAIHVKTPFANFDLIYRFENGDFVAQRDLVVLRNKLPAKSWQEYKKFAADISLGEMIWVQLNAKNSSGTGPHPPKPGENNPQAATLVYDANELEKKSDYTTALEKLDEAKKINPEQPWLWSNYGYIAMVQNHPDDAEKYFRHEIANNPDESYPVQLLAGLLLRRSKTGEALSVLKSSFDRDASNPAIAIMLSSQQARDNLDDAIATLRKAATAKPEDVTILSELANLLIRDNHKPEAVATATKLLGAAAEDPYRLNNSAYLLAEADGDLAVAEKNSRKSIEILEAQTAVAAASEANQQSFNRTSLLIASWDTLGYILLREKKQDTAIDYLEAAWKNRPELTVGLHYGQALEAADQRGEALRIYQQANTLVHGKPESDPDWQVLQENIARLKAASVDLRGKSVVPQNLQEERTFHLNMDAHCQSFASSTFRMLIGASGPTDVLLVSGNTVPDKVIDSIRQLPLSHMVPSASNAKILRDAVFTCSAGKSDGFLVLMPLGGMQAEHAGD
jgi:tetratricopeptide (TPR) repeat protein/transglutaminase-like putative cysteine protease